MSYPDHLCGPGPIILGPDGQGHIITRTLNTPGTQTHTRHQLEALPIHPQWLTGTPQGLLASWPNEQTARDYANAKHTRLARIITLTARDAFAALDQRGDFPTDTTRNDTIVILTDPNGTPLRGLR